jgi:hypothetical protein
MLIYYGVLPKHLTANQIRKCKPHAMARILYFRRLINDDIYEAFRNVLCWADAAINCNLVAAQSNALLFDIDVLHDIINRWPCGEAFERLHADPPNPFGSFGGGSDDGDAAESWKGGR